MKKFIYPKENWVLWSTVCMISSKLLIKRASVYKFYYRNPKMRLDLQSQKTISLLITITVSLNIRVDKFAYRSDLETSIVVSFPSKSFKHSAINLFFQKRPTLTIAKFTIFIWTDVSLHTNVKNLRAITISRSITTDCGSEKGTNIFFGDVYCSKSKCLGKFCLHKRTFQSLGRSDYLCRQSAFVCEVRNIPFVDQTNSFFLSFVQRVYVFEENPKSIQDVIEDVCCPGK